ncbi:MAG: DUF6671 family protein [Pseudomonadota bacterium]
MAKVSFTNSEVIFATNHSKALAAKEPFSRILNATVNELTIDSDSLGTFSGEVERQGSMLDALRAKIKLAQNATEARFVMASEGSFGSADGLGFASQGIELLLLSDRATGAEILEQQISWHTNYSTATLSTDDELLSFLNRIGFGSHALVLYPQGIAPSELVYKGIVELSDAQRAFKDCVRLSPHGKAVAMSDMRAHLNPTRMLNIGECCELLAKRLATPCPSCGSGGFGLGETISGLPCEGCGAPTQRAVAEWHGCPFCKERARKPRSDGVTKASAAECEWCNP